MHYFLLKNILVNFTNVIFYGLKYSVLTFFSLISIDLAEISQLQHNY